MLRRKVVDGFLALTLCVMACGHSKAENVSRSAVGVNLSAVSPGSVEFPFTNYFYHARPWSSPQPQTRPGQSEPSPPAPERPVRTFLFTNTPHPTGRFILSHQGRGRLLVGAAGRVIEASQEQTVVAVNGRKNLLFELVGVDSTNPLRGFRLTKEGELGFRGTAYREAFVRSLDGFSVLRFMDWQMTNQATERQWSRRALPSDSTQTTSGVALELMVDLCNLTDAAPWFCIPHTADDHFVRQFARLVNDRLAPGLPVYIEHSNEVWNFRFPQARYCAAQGKQRGLSENRFEAVARYHAERSVEIFRVVQSEFGDRRRQIRVLGSQARNPWFAETALRHRDTFGHVDAVSIAPYFGHELGDPELVDERISMSLDELFMACQASLSEVLGKVSDYSAICRDHDLALIAYEGGQHLAGYGGAENNPRLVQMFHSANRDPRMGQLYTELLNGWKENGGQLFVAYCSAAAPSKWGCWGLQEYGGQPLAEAHKLRAVSEFASGTPRWWKD